MYQIEKNMEIDEFSKNSILIVDDDRRMAKTLIDILSVKGFNATPAYDGKEALSLINSTDFDCVLTDIKMPYINGVELYKSIKSIKPETPVILMTAYATHNLVNEGIEAGAIGALTKPLDINLLLSFFASINKEQAIVIIDDDPDFNKTIGDILRQRGYAIENITSPDIISNDYLINSDLVLLDLKIGDCDSLDLLSSIRDKFPHLPVIIITGYRNEMSKTIQTALSMGAYTCLYKPLEVEQLINKIIDIKKLRLKRLLNKSQF